MLEIVHPPVPGVVHPQSCLGETRPCPNQHDDSPISLTWGFQRLLRLGLLLCFRTQK
jgi:hypothetical protein